MPKPPSTAAQNVVRNLVAIRTRWKLSVPKMAMIVGVPANTLVRWEGGDRGARLSSLDVVARGLECSPDALLASEPPALDEIPPAFGLTIVDEAASPALIAQAVEAIRNANMAYRAMRRLEKATGASSSPTTPLPGVAVAGPPAQRREAAARAERERLEAEAKDAAAKTKRSGSRAR